MEFAMFDSASSQVDEAPPAQIELLKQWNLAYGLGLPISGMLLGVIFMLAGSYYRDFKDDRNSTKASVVIVIALTMTDFMINFAVSLSLYPY